MHFSFPTVNEAFIQLVHDVYLGDIPTYETDSRNGPVIQIAEPVIVTYQNPVQRVLFNGARDCNPFFHLYEALWMLAGRNDVAPLAYYNKQMAEYSDDGETFNGAYGYRWRSSSPRSDSDEYEYGVIDQLNIIVHHLHQNPNSRRAVLQMWNVEDDLMKIHADEAGLGVRYSKDVCCNLSCTFQLRTEQVLEEHQTISGLPVVKTYLDMTVFNRSNDMVWGMFGANVVHFSFLQEYIAAKLKVQVGVYNQVSANLHVYKNKWEPEKWLTDDVVGTYTTQVKHPHFPLLVNKDLFDHELLEFVEINKDASTIEGDISWDEPFFQHVAQPMCHAFHMHKLRDYDAAYYWAEQVQAADWQYVAIRWLNKRHQRWESRNPYLERTEAKDACE